MKSFLLNKKTPTIIAGPCSAESREQTIETCKKLAATGVVDLFRAGVWKPRTTPGSFEGVGTKGLKWMAEAKQLTGLPIAVEVATPKHVESALKYGVDVVWLGARTTVSPFSVQEIADALKGNKDTVILIKNPVNPDLGLWAGAVTRLLNADIDSENIGLIHRGFSYFGHSKYRNAPMWHIALEMRSRFPELSMFCDPSHISGSREYLQEISQTAADMRYDGLIVESHINPDAALSDAGQQITPAKLGEMVAKINWRADSTDNPDYIENLRKLREEIDQIDSELFEILSRRMKVSEEIGVVKRQNNVAILQGERWQSIVERFVTQAKALDLSEEFINSVLQAIHIESINRQNKIMNK